MGARAKDFAVRQAIAVDGGGACAIGFKVRANGSLCLVKMGLGGSPESSEGVEAAKHKSFTDVKCFKRAAFVLKLEPKPPSTAACRIAGASLFG